jgi:hypothetical protein
MKRTKLTSLVLTFTLTFLYVHQACADGAYHNQTYGFTLTAPQGWSFLTPDEVRARTSGAITPSANTLVFVVNNADADQNINFQFTADTHRDAPTNSSSRQVLQNFQSQLLNGGIRKISPDAAIVNSSIVDLAGGVALETTITSHRGTTIMEQKSIILIVNGEAFTITCTAREPTYLAADREAFQPILDSLVFK